MGSASEKTGKESTVEGTFAGIVLYSVAISFELIVQAVRYGVTECAPN